jgi:hypothetical protein
MQSIRFSLFSDVGGLVKSIFSLFSNQITKLSDSYNLPFRSTLGTFFLGENHLTSIPSDFFRKKIRQNIT